jgi:Zinc-finger domain of monoamine-oxidase A repressor R1
VMTQVEVRRSGRVQGTAPEHYTEDAMLRRMGLDRLDLLPTRRRRVNVDPEQLKKLREERMSDVNGTESADAGNISYDSGLGVRIQGGRVYDSKYGVTCHWCRQKTLEEHVECTSEGCGGGHKLTVTFW